MVGQANLGLDAVTGILQSLPDPVFVLTRSGRYAAVFGGTDTRYYFDGSGLAGKSLFDVLKVEKARWFLSQIEMVLDSRRMHVIEYSLGGSDVAGLSDDGPEGQVWFEGRVQALPQPVEGEDAVLWVASNVHERHQMMHRLQHLSETDELSDLANRRKLMGFLIGRLAEFTRYGAQTAVLCFDIDHFKSINDDHGHEVGDKAIVAAAQACQAALRQSDMAARLGGDEFVVVLPHTPMSAALQTANRLREAISGALRGLGITGHGTTISGGVSEFRAGDASVDDVLKRADAALYRAKSAGRDRVELDALNQPAATSPGACHADAGLVAKTQ